MMTKPVKYLMSIMAITLLSACASRPEAVRADYISPAMFTGLSCDQLKVQQAVLMESLQDTSHLQRKARRRDTIAWSVGTLVAWPATLFAIGNNRETELSKLKGRMRALDMMAVEQDCWYIVGQTAPSHPPS